MNFDSLSYPIFHHSLTPSPIISFIEIVHRNSIGGAINLYAAYSANGRISVRCFLQKFLPPPLSTDSLYSHFTWVTNAVCSLFRYFSTILFAAYTVNRQILVRFSWKFLLSPSKLHLFPLFQN